MVATSVTKHICVYKAIPLKNHKIHTTSKKLSTKQKKQQHIYIRLQNYPLNKNNLNKRHLCSTTRIDIDITPATKLPT